jgi:hypothetical protein
MNHNDWNDEEENFNIALSQRTEELYRIPTMEPDEDGCIIALVWSHRCSFPAKPPCARFTKPRPATKPLSD